MDLSKFEIGADESAEMQLMHPADGTPLVDPETKLPITISLLSEDSKRVRDAQRLTINGRLKNQSRMKYTAEMVEADAINLIVEATVSWSGIELDGASLSFSKANAKILYGRLPWLKIQVDSFMTDRSNFLSTSSKT